MNQKEQRLVAAITATGLAFIGAITAAFVYLFGGEEPIDPPVDPPVEPPADSRLAVFGPSSVTNRDQRPFVHVTSRGCNVLQIQSESQKWAELLANGHVNERGDILSVPNGETIRCKAWGWSDPAGAVGLPVEISWKGSGDVGIGAEVTQREPNRVIVTGGERSNIFWVKSGPISDVAIKLVGAPEATWTEDFLSEIEPYEYVRMLSFTKVNNNWINRLDQLTPADGPYWGADVPLEEQAKLTAGEGKILWTHAHPYLGVSDADVAAIQRAEVPAAAARAEAILSDTAPVLRAWAKRLADALADAGYPADRPLIVEHGNEPWNSARDFKPYNHLAYGVACGLFFPDQVNDCPAKGTQVMGAGIWAAHLALAMDAVAPDLPWSVAVNTQTGDWKAERALEGARRYLERVKRPALFKRLTLAMAPYYGGVCQREYGPVKGDMFGTGNDAEYYARLKEEILRDPEGLRERAEAYLINEALPQVIANAVEVKAVADAAGIPIIAYEGGNHDNTKKNTDPVIREWCADFEASENDARVITAYVDQWFEVMPDVPVANFVGVLPTDPGGPWNDSELARDAWASAISK